MLGLYLYILIIGHNSCKMLNILNKLTYFKELQTFVTNNVFLDKKLKHNNNKTNKIQFEEPDMKIFKKGNHKK